MITKLTCRLYGAPAEKFTKEISLKNVEHIYQLKEKIKRIYNLNEILIVQILWKGKMLTDSMLIKDIPFEQDSMINLMVTQTGG